MTDAWHCTNCNHTIDKHDVAWDASGGTLHSECLAGKCKCASAVELAPELLAKLGLTKAA